MRIRTPSSTILLAHGLVGRILDGPPTTELAPDWTMFLSPRERRAPGLHIAYQEHGGPVILHDPNNPEVTS